MFVSFDEYLHNISSTFENFFIFFKYVFKAISISSDYINELPIYFVSTISVVVIISIVLMIVGR